MTAPSPVDLEMASRIPVFSGLKSQGLEVLLEKASIVNLRAGHVLFRQGEPAQAFFIVMEGWIKLYRVTAAGDEAVLQCADRRRELRGGCHLHIRPLSRYGLRRHPGQGHGDTPRIM